MVKVIIIGGGASGLMAAIVAAQNQCKVTVLEQKEKLGKKILATGNGKCNYTNYHQSKDCYRGQDIDKALKVYTAFDATNTINFFRTLGIYPKQRNGYVYPNSGQASSVQEALILEAKRLGVELVCDTKVTAIIPTKSGFSVQTPKAKYTADHVILTTGGCASANLGSDGSGYELAKKLGHSIIKPLPALVQLKSNAKYLKTISGVRCDAQIQLNVSGYTPVVEQGEILFANYGISGIPVLQVSRFASVGLSEGRKVELMIDFMPELSFEQLLDEVMSRYQRHSNRTAEQLLIGLFNYKLTYILMKETGIDPECRASKIEKNLWNQLCRNIKKFTMKITDTNGFDNAQTCVGGIPLAEINCETMESKKVKGLYFAGELLDVDGTCGGYNLQWAWSSGYVAGAAQQNK